MTRKNTWLILGAALAFSLPITACKDTKTLQENETLKSQVAELQKENGQLGNNVETLTAAQDALTKENEKLKAEINGSKRTKKKSTARRRRRHNKTEART